MDTKFKVNQKVVYPSQGVGVVTEIFEKKFKDEMNLYYKIYIEASDMIVMVPVAKAEELGIRQIVSTVQKLLSLIRSHLLVFLFIFITLGGGSKKILLRFMLKSVLPVFSSKSFTVSGLTFRSLIHFEFILVYGVRKCSSFILFFFFFYK